MPKAAVAERLHESIALSEATKGAPTGRRMRIKLIDAGLGSSGLYSEAVLKKAAADGIFGAGLHMYLDHPTMTEAEERPERSVRDLAAVLATGATYSAGALYAEATVFPAYQQILAEMRDSIGVSIRACGMAETGEYEGQRVRVITELTEALSVDFVTHAGRGGEIVSLLESARAVPVREVAGMTANDARDALYTAIKDAYGAEKTYLWIRDYTDDWVVFEVDTDDSCELFKQAFTAADGVVTLAGDRTEVVARTEYLPAPEASDTSESARQLREARNVGHWIESRLHLALTQLADQMFGDGNLTREERIALSSAVGDGLKSFTASLEQDAPQLYQRDLFDGPPEPGDQSVTESTTPSAPGRPAVPEGAPTMADKPGAAPTTPDKPTEPIAEAATTESTELAEAKRQLDEANRQLAQIGENARRATAAEAQLAESRKENNTLRAGQKARDAATVKLGESGLPEAAWPRVIGVVTSNVPLTEAGDLDTEKSDAALVAAIESEKAYIAALAEAGGTGVPRGLGGAPAGEQVLSEADFEKAAAAKFAEWGYDEKTAATAAKGR